MLFYSSCRIYTSFRDSSKLKFPLGYQSKVASSTQQTHTAYTLGPSHQRWYSVKLYPKRKRKIIRKSRTSVSKLKKKLWVLVSEFVRRSSADKDGFVKCVTCGARKHWKEMQAGHFEQGRKNAILYVLKGIHPQCIQCNIFLHGNLRKYEKFMKQTYGQKCIDSLDALRETTVQFTTPQLLSMIDQYKKKLARL